MLNGGTPLRTSSAGCRGDNRRFSPRLSARSSGATACRLDRDASSALHFFGRHWSAQRADQCYELEPFGGASESQLPNQLPLLVWHAHAEGAGMFFPLYISSGATACRARWASKRCRWISPCTRNTMPTECATRATPLPERQWLLRTNAKSRVASPVMETSENSLQDQHIPT